MRQAPVRQALMIDEVRFVHFMTMTPLVTGLSQVMRPLVLRPYLAIGLPLTWSEGGPSAVCKIREDMRKT